MPSMKNLPPGRLCLALFVLVVAGCGGGGTTALDQETAAVKHLLALEAKVAIQSKETKKEAREFLQSVPDCRGNLACMEASAPQIEQVSGELNRQAREFRSIHRRLNDYSHAALRAAFRAR